MDVDTTSQRFPWETPSTVALTDTESRADQADVVMRNIVASSGGG